MSNVVNAVTANWPASRSTCCSMLGMIILFQHFYSRVCSIRRRRRDNLKKYGGFIPGIRPGSATAEYFDRHPDAFDDHRCAVLVAGLSAAADLTRPLRPAFYFGGTSLMIIVSVTMDTITQMHRICWRINMAASLEERVKGRGR